MKIIGLNIYHADSAACLMDNGKLLSAIEEERINRVKHWAGFPSRSINFCLENNNLIANNIDCIAINSNTLSNAFEKIKYLIFNLKKNIKGNIKRHIKKNLISKSISDLKFNKEIKILRFDHHLCHIASAYYPSNFDKCIALSVDGFGDFASLNIALCEKKNLKILKRIYFPHSIGLLYEAITQHLGFDKYGEEYKVMGMSAYGKPKYYENIKNLFFLDNNNFKLKTKYFNHINNNFNYKFEGSPYIGTIFNEKINKILGEKRLLNQITQDHYDLASSIQLIFEEIIEYFLKKIDVNTKNLILSGGCAYNSLSNGKIARLSKFDDIFVPQSPGDAGGALGAAFLACIKNNVEIKKNSIQNPYLGSEYTDAEISSVINTYFLNKNHNIRVDKLPSDILIKNTAKILSKGKVVGWFQSKMEFGSRALGNRSILADPSNPNMKQIINSKIKLRENFRPFAPSILEEYLDDWFECKIKSPYMSFVYKIKPAKQSNIPAVVHNDGTGRVHTVSKSLNFFYYRLILEFYKITKIPMLLNTSFNENEPIVQNPNQAIETFLRTEMDALAIGNYLIQR
jgi:carbamoyltransferase